MSLYGELQKLMDLEVRASSKVMGREPVECPVCRRPVPARLLQVHARGMGDDEHGVLLVMEG